MKGYIYKRNKDGVHYMDIAKTWEKLMVAARVIAAAQSKNQKDVLVSCWFQIAKQETNAPLYGKRVFLVLLIINFRFRLFPHACTLSALS
jgi:hypothetical protein